MNEMDECEPIPITCLVSHCVSCNDESICNECNAPFTLNQANECQLCEEGTYFKEGSCESISILNKND